MVKRLLLLSTCLSVLLLGSCENKKPGVVSNTVAVLAPVAVSKTNSAKLYMHYMPWFEDKSTSGNYQWGSHWTMSNRNPDIVDANGNRQIASFYNPLIGPYASSDKDVIEYHLLLMKYAGVDGLLFDWYGSYSVNDYALIKRNTEAVVAMLAKVGLKFAIVYEDQTTQEVVNAKQADSKVAAAAADFSYLKSKFFSDKSYISVNGKPLLLVFGPRTIKTESDWTMAFSGLQTKPCALTIWNQKSDMGANATGEFGWVYQSDAALDNFYSNRVSSLSVAMGSAYPGFKDYYSQGGWGTSLGWTIDYNNGETLTRTLQKAKDAKMDMIQLVTWNDYGEGTMLEPTKEFGFSFVEKIGAFAGTNLNSSSFQTIYKLYQLRKKYASNVAIQKQLDQVFYYLVSLQVDKAEAGIEAVAGK